MIAPGDTAPDFELPDHDGQPLCGVLRSTFVIDADGTVVHVIPKVSPKTHDEQVLGVLAGM